MCSVCLLFIIMHRGIEGCLGVRGWGVRKDKKVLEEDMKVLEGDEVLEKDKVLEGD